MEELVEILKENILFYDGDCGFCNKSVQFILKNQHSNELKFMPLQHPMIDKISVHFDVKMSDLNTLYLLKNGKMYTKSSAALRIVPYFKWYWKFLYIGYIIPNFLRDKVYDFIAERRKKIAGEFCYLPNGEENKQFIRI